MEGEKSVIVVDACVIVKWFVDEEYSRAARLLRDSYVNGLIEIAVPALMPYEVLNALKYSGAYGEDELKEIAEVLEDYQFETYDLSGDLAKRTVEIAMRKGLTIYDASYVALAEKLNTVLYTADEKIIRKIRDENLVRHISHYSP